MTFGQRLKKYRKEAGLTQLELAEAIGVSMQAISKWETDVGMPDISQIVPLSHELSVSSDILLGIAKEDENTEFEAIRAKCYEIEGTPISCNWPPKAQDTQRAFDLMYEYFSSHPNDVSGSKYLLHPMRKVLLKNVKDLQIVSSVIARMRILSMKRDIILPLSTPLRVEKKKHTKF